MKSTTKALKKRGMATTEEITALSKLSFTELILNLNHTDASIRSAAAVNLQPFIDTAADALLTQLQNEQCLYTRIAICESLELGNIETAKKMTAYLGSIGNNQHRILPLKVSAKKSFPLPRDIIARSLGRMDVAVYPALMEVLESNHTKQICEVLDAIGYMVFYNSVLATDENCNKIISLSNRYPENQIILWKMILCLSAFPCRKSVDILLKFELEESIIGLEAQRSLWILERRNGL